MATQPLIYGFQGMSAAGSVPAARYGAVGWTDPVGNLWLFGGAEGDPFSEPTAGYLNDLWEYAGGQWKQVSGSNLTDQPATYGSKGTAAAANVPGGRTFAVTWTDPTGNLWLFGGLGHDSTGFVNYNNDLWEYSLGQWTWMSGSDVSGQQGTYGNLGTPAPGNVPGARQLATAWTDAAGSFWLFGGHGEGTLNDLWKYTEGQWTWMGGSDMFGQYGTYGIQGAAAAGNVPGDRAGAFGWTDKDGNFWMFGGDGSSSTTVGYLNDLWRYEP